MFKAYKEDRKGNWYGVFADDNLVVTNNKSMQFEFSVLKWFNAGDLFVGKIKKV